MMKIVKFRFLMLVFVSLIVAAMLVGCSMSSEDLSTREAYGNAFAKAMAFRGGEDFTVDPKTGKIVFNMDGQSLKMLDYNLFIYHLASGEKLIAGKELWDSFPENSDIVELSENTESYYFNYENWFGGNANERNARYGAVEIAYLQEYGEISFEEAKSEDIYKYAVTGGIEQPYLGAYQKRVFIALYNKESGDSLDENLLDDALTFYSPDNVENNELSGQGVDFLLWWERGFPRQYDYFHNLKVLVDKDGKEISAILTKNLNCVEATYSSCGNHYTFLRLDVTRPFSWVQNTEFRLMGGNAPVGMALLVLPAIIITIVRGGIELNKHPVTTKILLSLCLILNVAISLTYLILIDNAFTHAFFKFSL